jgi:hypothetical protein
VKLASYTISIYLLYITCATVGSALLCDVKRYQSKEEFMADQNKHFAVSAYSEPLYGFLLSDANRLDKPIPLKGRLGFFDVNM